eukprot:2989613-Prymnesium_polylepis.1
MGGEAAHGESHRDEDTLAECSVCVERSPCRYILEGDALSSGEGGLGVEGLRADLDRVALTQEAHGEVHARLEAWLGDVQRAMAEQSERMASLLAHLRVEHAPSAATCAANGGGANGSAGGLCALEA